MEKSDEIVNKVATSSLVVFDLAQYYQPGDRVLLDLKDQLYQGIILKEKDFRSSYVVTTGSSIRTNFWPLHVRPMPSSRYGLTCWWL